MSCGADGGGAVDKFKVEWDTSAGFDSASYGYDEVKANSSLATDATYLVRGKVHQYNVTGLAMGVKYYVRVTAHTSAGYGNAAGAKEAVPMQSADPPFGPALQTLSTLSGAYSAAEVGSQLSLTWAPPLVDVPGGDLVGPGGDGVDAYLVEWSKKPWARYEPQVAVVTVVRDDHWKTRGVGSLATSAATATGLYGSFRLGLNTTDAAFAPVAGYYASAEIDVLNASAYDVEIIIENMPNVGDVTVAKTAVVDDDGQYGDLVSSVTYTITFESEVANMLNESMIYNVGGYGGPGYSPLERRGGLLSIHSTSFADDPADAGTPSAYVNTTQLARIPTGADYAQAVVPVGAGSGGAFDFAVSPLIAGVEYFVRVSARNQLGFARGASAPRA